MHIRALDGLRFADHFHHVALRVRHDLALAVVAGKQVVVHLLDAATSHRIAQLKIAAFGHACDIVAGHAAGITHRVRRKGAMGIIADRAGLHGDARERIGMLGDEGDVAHAGVACHHALALRAARCVGDALAHDTGRNAQHRGQTGDRIVVVGNVGLGEHCERRAVLHDDVAVGVQDVAARRRGIHRGVLVVLGLFLERFAGKHLHAPQLRGKRAEDQACHNAHGGKAAFQVVARIGHRLGGRSAAGNASGRHAMRIGKRAAHAHRLDGADVALDADVLGFPAAKHHVNRHQDSGDYQKS